MKHFDVEKVKGYFAGDPMIFRNFLALLQKELPKSLLELQQCFEQQDLEGIKEAAHKLKGTGLSAGLEILTAIASKLNKLDSFDPVMLNGLIAEVQTETAYLLPLIEKEQSL